MAAPGKITADKREVLENLWVLGCTYAQIGRMLGVHPTSVSREIARNGSGKHGLKNPIGRQGRRSYKCGYAFLQVRV